MLELKTPPKFIMFHKPKYSNEAEKVMDLAKKQHPYKLTEVEQ